MLFSNILILDMKISDMNMEYGIKSLINYIPILVFILFSNSCTNNLQNKEVLPTETDSVRIIQGKPSSSFKDTITIDFPAAVFFNTDKVQSEKYIERNGKKVFDSIQHDCFYQMKYSRDVLKKYYPKMKVTEVINSRYLRFITANSGYNIIDLNNYDLCGLFISDGQKDPIVVDMTNVETQLGFYF
jgi:hypothetical protein